MAQCETKGRFLCTDRHDRVTNAAVVPGAGPAGPRQSLLRQRGSERVARRVGRKADGPPGVAASGSDALEELVRRLGLEPRTY